MLRLYFLLQWYALSDPVMEDALYEIESMHRFAGLELSNDALPDETKILKFRHLLEKQGLTAQMMNVINDTPAQQGLLLKGGTMADATIIHVPPSTKKQGKQWYFGMKIHVGADVNSGLAHTVSVMPANASDISQLPHLLREDDRAVFGDKGYVNNDLKCQFGYTKVRYKRIAKNAAQVFLLIGLTNLCLTRGALMSGGAKSVCCA